MNNNYSVKSLQLPLTNGKHFLILFLLWPFMAFIAALFNYSQKESRKVVYIFLVYYGFTFALGNIGADAEEYVRRLKNIAELPFSDFFQIVGGMYSSDTSVDIVQPLITFIVSRFTDHHSVLFAAFAAVFGIFYLKSINLLYDRHHEKPGWNTAILMIFFIMILPITSINGFRMWTATWIFFFGAYHVILYRDSRYLLITMGASLVHFSFISANVILLIYYFAGNRNLFYIPIALASFVIPQFLTPFFQTISLRLGGGLQSRYEMYSNEEYVLGRQESFEQAIWFVKLSSDLLFYYLLFALIAIQIWHREKMNDSSERNLFSFILLFLAFVNFGKGIPSFGGRFQILFFLFTTFYLFLFFRKIEGTKVNVLTIIGLFPMLLYAALQFRNATDSISAWILTPGLGLPLFVPTISLANILFN